jgi:hypothetical protein
MKLLSPEFNRIDIAHIFISPDFALAISLSPLNNCILKKGLEFGIIMVTFKDFVESCLEAEGGLLRGNESQRYASRALQAPD